MSHAVASRHGYRGGERRRLGDRTYETWHSMLERCFNPKHEQYADYGGRGITVCLRWLEFTNFLVDMGEKPRGLSLERSNNDGDYVLSNCRWATKERNRNKRRNHLLAIDGVTRTLVEWAEISKIDRRTILSRVRRGWPSKVAVFEPAVSSGPRLLRTQAVLTTEKVVVIRKLAAAGITQQTLAEKFFISQPTVGQIVRRVTWRHV